MKISRFIFRTDFPATEEILLYNTLNGSLLAIEKKNRMFVDEMLSKKVNIDVDSEIKEMLLEEEFLLQDDFDEISIILERSNLGISDENRLDVIIMPTMDCNFACSYCYEEHHPSKISEETQENLLKWFENIIPRFKCVRLNWFGGEPLLAYQAIVQLQNKLTKICDDYKIPHYSHITTNGYLLNKDRIKQLVNVGIYSYQITLDGTSEFHNRTRRLRNGLATFDKIRQNIIDLIRQDNQVNIKLRVNYDDINIDSVFELLPLFPENVRKQIILVCERIFGEKYGVFKDDQINYGIKTAELYAFASKLGYSSDIDELKPGQLTFCYADRYNQFLFNYNGDVFKCTVGKFEHNQSLGYLNSEGKIIWRQNMREKWHQVKAFEEKCFTCVFMPVCMGGCRKVKQVFGCVGDDCTLPFKGFESRVRNLYSEYLNQNKNEKDQNKS